jgi:hypothetical protein
MQFRKQQKNETKWKYLKKENMKHTISSECKEVPRCNEKWEREEYE